MFTFLKNRWARRPARAPARPPQTARPQLESLDQRAVPSVTVVQPSGNGPFTIYARGLDQQVWAQPFVVTGGPMYPPVGLPPSQLPSCQSAGPWQLMLPGQVSALAATTGPGFPFYPGAAQDDLFGVGLDGQVYHSSVVVGTASPWALVALGQVQSIAVRPAYSGIGDYAVYAIGLDNQVWQLKGGTFSWVLTAPGQVKSIALGHDAANNDRVFAVGLDSQVWEQSFDSHHTSGGLWSLTQPGQVQSIAVASDPGSGVPILGAVGLDSQMWQQPLGPSGQSLGGWQLVAPGLVRQVIPDYLGFYAIGPDQQLLTTLAHQLIGLNIRVQDVGLVHWSYFVVGTTRQVQTATLLQGLDNQLWLATTVSPLTLTAPGQIL